MTDDPDPTVELLRRWNAGDRGALDSLLSRHLGALHEYVRGRLGRELLHLRREQDSMDLVQQAATRVLQYTPAFVPENGRQFQRLLRKIVANDIVSRMRAPSHSQREPSRERFGDSLLDFRASANTSLLPDRAAERSEEQAQARAWARMALEFLPEENDRRLVLLASVEEWSWPEIGAELGLSPDAARMRFQRLLPKLANHVRMLREGRVEELLGNDGS